MNDQNPSASALRKHVEQSLTARLFSHPSPPAAWPGYSCYTHRVEDALVPGLGVDQLRDDLKRGQGKELKPDNGKPPKFHAAYSSCALVVNTLGVFRSSALGLRLAGQSDFASLEFEFPCPTGAGRGIANLDALAQGSGLVVGIESKLCEVLSKKVAKFSSKYDSTISRTANMPWARLYQDLKREPEAYLHVDAAQLVKHYLGLKAIFRRETVVLLYLFWEPVNATRFGPYRVHAQEVESLSQRLSDADIPLVALRYPELWDAIEPVHPRHVQHLRARYQLVL